MRGDNSPSDQPQTTSQTDPEKGYKRRANGHEIGVLHPVCSRTESARASVLIDWEVDDPENPHNWSKVACTYSSATYTRIDIFP